MMSVSKHKGLLLAAALLLLLAGAAIWKRPTPPPAPASPVAEDFEPRRMTLEGVLACAPPAPGVAPVTKECPLALRADDGAHYAVDFSLMSNFPEPHENGDRVTGNGVFTPIERLSSDRWQRYDLKGVFSVTDGFKVLR